MANNFLDVTPALAGYDHDFGQVRLTEATTLAIVSLAIPQGSEAKCAKAIKSAYGAETPESGRFTTSKDGALRVIRTAPDQMLVLFEHHAPDARNVVHSATSEAFWTTEQTDVWCALDISGPMARAALERICPLDLHPAVFGEDHAARTVMEHMGAMILRTGENSFLLMSARSSAKSFLHAVETSIINVL